MKHKLIFIALLVSIGSFLGLYAQGNVNAVYFDGVNDHVQVGSSLGIGNSFTVEGWIRPSSLTGTGDIATHGRSVFSASSDVSIYPLWVTVLGSNILVRSWSTSSTGVTISAGLSTGQWYHIAVTATKGGTTRTYLNGVQINSYTNLGQTNWPTTFTIGAIRPSRPGGDGTNLAFAGLMDEVRVWNTVRSASDILTYMSVPVATNSPGLVGYWKFDEAAPGTIAYDSAGTAQNGTLAQGAYFTTSDLTLPIELSSFTATITSQYFVQLHWVTQSETDALGYMIYRSLDNDLQHAIQVSPLINATNTATQVSYEYTDSEVTPGTWFYWLQSLDLSGNFNFHGPILATVSTEQGGEAPPIPTATGISKVYPNPFNPSLTVRYELKEALPVSFRIYNTRGQIVQSYDLGIKEAASHDLIWDASGLPTGIYLIRLQAGNKLYSSKAVLSK